MSTEPAAPALSIAGQTLRLLPERCVYWEETGVLLLADLHLGKAAHLRHHGIAVPEGHTADDLARLTRVMLRTGAAEVVFCGDFFHAPAAQSPAILDLVEQWRNTHHRVHVQLVTGNHDRGRAMPPERCGIAPAGPRLARGPLHFIHDPADACGKLPTVSGHLHPLASLTLSGSPSFRAPCFWWRTAHQCLVLPGFGSFTAGVAIQPEPEDTLHVIHNNKVSPVPAHFCRPPALRPRSMPLPERHTGKS